MILKSLQELDRFDSATISGALERVSASLDIKLVATLKLLRAIVAGGKMGAGIADTMSVLGREESLSRIDHYLKTVSDNIQRHAKI
jgi:glutamyl/glutaminyl-tRNA synthetase